MKYISVVSLMQMACNLTVYSPLEYQKHLLIGPAASFCNKKSASFYFARKNFRLASADTYAYTVEIPTSMDKHSLSYCLWDLNKRSRDYETGTLTNCAT